MPSRWRRIVGVVVGAGALVATAGTAGAGGSSSVLMPDDPTAVFHAGDRVHLRASNVVKNDPTWHGPYRVYLRPDRQGMGLAGLAPAGESPEDVEVGSLTLTRVDPMSVSADITFTMPTLADGGYRVLVCNEGCANPLQIYENTINVGMVPLPTVPETLAPTDDVVVAPTSAAPVTARIVAVPDAPAPTQPVAPAERAATTNPGPSLVVAFAAGAALALVARRALAGLRRRRPVPRAPRIAPAPGPAIEVVPADELDDLVPTGARDGSLV